MPVLQFPPDKDGVYRAECIDGPLRGVTREALITSWIEVVHGPLSWPVNLDGVVQIMRLEAASQMFVYEWSSHWIYSHCDTPGGGVVLTQVQVPCWRCGES